MKTVKWEYRVLEASFNGDYREDVDPNDLDKLGLEGWEAVSASFELDRENGCLVGVLLKRPIQEPVKVRKTKE